jgi:excisionase family DNA binding protein
MNEVVDERLMTIAELSMMLGVPIDTLYGWRHRGEGPRGYRVGRHVRYRRSSVEAWLEEQADRLFRTGVGEWPTSSDVAFASRTALAAFESSPGTGCATATRTEGSTARPSCDWSMPSVVRLRLKSLWLEGPGVTHAGGKCVCMSGLNCGCHAT